MKIFYLWHDFRDFSWVANCKHCSELLGWFNLITLFEKLLTCKNPFWTQEELWRERGWHWVKKHLIEIRIIKTRRLLFQLLKKVVWKIERIPLHMLQIKVFSRNIMLEPVLLPKLNSTTYNFQKRYIVVWLPTETFVRINIRFWTCNLMATNLHHPKRFPKKFNRKCGLCL